MTGYSDLTIWTIILLSALGTYGLRWSFLGAFGNRPMPVWAQRLLRYTAVAVLPALVAPAVLWPPATGGSPDPVRLVTVAITLLAGILSRNMIAAIAAGGAAFYLLPQVIG